MWWCLLQPCASRPQLTPGHSDGASVGEQQRAHGEVAHEPRVRGAPTKDEPSETKKGGWRRETASLFSASAYPPKTPPTIHISRPIVNTSPLSAPPQLLFCDNPASAESPHVGANPQTVNRKPETPHPKSQALTTWNHASACTAPDASSCPLTAVTSHPSNPGDTGATTNYTDPAPTPDPVGHPAVRNGRRYMRSTIALRDTPGYLERRAAARAEADKGETPL